MAKSKLMAGDRVKVLHLKFPTGMSVSDKVIGEIGVIKHIDRNVHFRYEVIDRIFVHFEHIETGWGGDYWFAHYALELINTMDLPRRLDPTGRTNRRM